MTVKHGFLLRLYDFCILLLFFSKNIILVIFFAMRYITMRSKPIYGLDKSIFKYIFYITIFVDSICYFT